MDRDQEISYRSGFTLIELIIASAIFVGLTLIAFTTLSNTSQVENRIEAQEDLNEAIQLSLESVIRELRNSEFEIQTASGGSPMSDITNNQRSGSRLKLNKINPVTGLSTQQYISLMTNQRHRYLALCSTQTCSLNSSNQLTPLGVEIESINFQGIDFSQNINGNQPFVQIALVAKTSDSEQEFRTLITSRRDK